MWQQWINFILGLWVLASAYVGMTASSMVTNLTITGIAVALFALWGALSHRTYHMPEQRHA